MPTTTTALPRPAPTPFQCADMALEFVTGVLDRRLAPTLSAGQQHRLNLIHGLSDIARYSATGELIGWQSRNGNFIRAKQSDRDLLALVRA